MSGRNRVRASHVHTPAGAARCRSCRTRPERDGIRNSRAAMNAAWPKATLLARYALTFRRIVVPRVAFVSVAAGNVVFGPLLPLERATCPAPFGVGHVFFLRRVPAIPRQGLSGIPNGLIHTGGIR